MQLISSDTRYSTLHPLRSTRQRITHPVRCEAKKQQQRNASAHASAAESHEVRSDWTSNQGAPESSCPFLRNLPKPPPAQNPWWTRLQQLFAPDEYQRTALGPHQMVTASSMLGMPEQVIVGTGAGVKRVLTGELDGTTTVASNKGLGGRRLLGEQSVLLAPEPHHKYLRSLIMPAFSPESIANLVPRMQRVLAKYLEAWAAATTAADAAGSGDGRPVQGHHELRMMTFEFIIAVVMGKDFDASTIMHLSDLYGTWSEGLRAWPFIDLPFTRYGKALAAMRELLAFFQVQVDEARAAVAAGQPVPGILGSFVTAEDEMGNRLNDAQIGDNLLLLMLAGHDTSSTTLTSALAELQKHPRVMQKLREEQQQLMQKYGDEINGAVLSKMLYADAIIRETLRVKNVVPAVFREAAQDIELEGYVVSQGTTLYLPLHTVIANDPRWLQDEPDVFRPERMLTPEGKKPGDQMPFGYGPRHCAGYSLAMAEMKVFLALLARGYEVSADIDTQWLQQIGKVPANGLPMRVTRVAAAPATVAA